MRGASRSPNKSDGFDFSETLSDPAAPARKHLMFAYRDVQRGYTDGRWKLIRYPQVDRTQLFDLRNGPHETKNLAAEPRQAARVAELTAALEHEMASNDDMLRLDRGH